MVSRLSKVRAVDGNHELESITITNVIDLISVVNGSVDSIAMPMPAIVWLCKCPLALRQRLATGHCLYDFF